MSLKDDDYINTLINIINTDMYNLVYPSPHGNNQKSVGQEEQGKNGFYTDYNKQPDVTWEGTAEDGKHPCHCDLMDLMREGCACGGS